MSRSGRLFLIAGIAFGVAIVALYAASRPLLLTSLNRAAAARHVEIACEALEPGWFAVTLRNVSLRPQGVPAELRLREVRVGLTALLRARSVDAHGGELTLSGPPETIATAIAQWQRAQPPRDPASRERARMPIQLAELAVRWADAGSRSSLNLDGVAVSTSDDGWQLGISSALAERANTRLAVEGATVSIGRDGALTAAHANGATVAWARGEHPEEAAPASPDPLPPALPSLATTASPTGPTPPPASVRLPFPDLRKLRAELAAVGRIAGERLAMGSRIDVASLSFALIDDGRKLSFGNGPLDLRRSADAVALTFTSGSHDDGTSVALSVTLPLKAADASVSLAGGPVSLGALGVDEGAAGLTDVGRTSVTGRGRIALGGDAADALTFDGAFSARALAIREPRLADDVIRGIDASLVARGTLDDSGSLRLDDGEIEFGALHLAVHGALRQSDDDLGASLAFELPATSCQNLLGSIPSALVPALEGAEVAGTLGARGKIAFDSRKLDDLVFDVNVDDRCTMTLVPELLAREHFLGPFDHLVYSPDGTLEDETTGPTTDNWTALDHISPYMQVAVLTTEDGAFYKHHGFNRAAMRNALVANLKAGHFVRGASTITMQLAKNLFLSREKTLSRKLEEIILADYLEQAFTKREMMELYLNIIEFGPNVYGITEAAMHYFGRRPDELNLAECLFLSSILPSPVRYHRLAEKPVLSESWTRHLHDLMAIAARLGTISAEELAEGEKSEVRFYDPKGPMPPSRPAVMGTHFQQQNVADVDWAETP